MGPGGKWVSRHPGLVLGIGFLFAVLATASAMKLELRTAFSELLPSNDPGVVAMQKTQKRMGDMSLLLVGIHSPDPDANIRYAEAITKRIHELPRDLAALATYHVRDVRDFFEANKWLYVGETELEDIRDRLRKEISRRKNPLFVDLGGDDEPIDQMQKRITGDDRLGDRFPDGLFATKDKSYLWIATLPPGGLFVEHAGEGLWGAINKILKDDPPSRYHPQMTVQLGGPVATAIASRKAVEDDIFLVTLTCLSIVAVSLVLYFRTIWALILITTPALVGTIMAFAVAEFAFGYLNSSTAFLGSIIIGNGINYAIVLTSRYQEERTRGISSASAMSAAINGTWKATGVASLSASAAYASLMVTSFRGFYQFGLMAAAGAFFCWISTYALLPAILEMGNQTAARFRKPSPTTPTRRTAEPSTGRPPLRIDGLGWLASRHFRPLLVVFGLITAASAVGATHFLRDPFEYDFRKLNTNVGSSEQAKQFGQNVDKLFGRWPSPTVILADELSEVEAIRDTIRKQDKQGAIVDQQHREVIGQITTIWDLLPGPPDVQARKLATLAQIRKLAHDPALEVLNETERAQLSKVDPPTTLRVLQPMDLPPIARRPFTEVDGSVGKVVLIYPVEERLSVWQGKDLLQIASVIQELKLPSGKVLETSGSAVVFGSMIRSILKDGPIATLASLFSVLLLVMLMIRPVRAGLMAAITLLVGVLWMVGAAGWAGVHVTFLNFIALPITFGIAAEYALNVVTRYRQDHDIIKAVTSTGAAVALCSWTTIVGYGSLLAAKNQALRGFGLMAILGEVACLTAAIMALPVALRWWASRGKA